MLFFFLGGGGGGGVGGRKILSILTNKYELLTLKCLVFMSKTKI